MKRKLIIILSFIVVIGIVFLYFGTRVENIKRSNSIQDERFKEIDMCKLYFNPVMPITIKKNKDIETIIQKLEKLELEGSDKEYEYLGSTKLEFYKDNKVQIVILIGGNMVCIEDDKYMGNKTQIENFLSYLTEYEK